MDKALQMGKISATGSFRLFIGKAVSTAIMAIGTIILARLMLPEEYGLYTIALIPPLMINLFQDWGISSAMTKYIAYYKATNKNEDIHNIIKAGIIFKTTTGLALSLTSLLLASFIATLIFNRPEITTLTAIASIIVLADSLLTASQSNFNGFEKMELNSITMVTQSIIKTTASPLLILLGYSSLGAVLGHTFSLLIAGIIGLIMLYFMLFRKLPKSNTPHPPNTIQTLKTMLRFGIPLSISTILGGFLMQFYAFMMVFHCTDLMIGNYQMAVNFSVLLTFFTFPIVTVLFPAFSKLNPKNEPQLLQTVFTSSVKYTAMLLIPATMAVMVLSKPIIYTLFGEKWVYAPFFLTLHSISSLFAIFGYLSISSLMAGLGETKMLLKLTLITLSLGIPLAFLLIPTYGIVGVILGTVTAGLPSLFWGLYWIWKHYNVKADYKSSAKIFTASTLAAIMTYLSLNFVSTTEWIQLAVGGTTFLATYILTAPTLGAITPTDINNLRTLLSGLGIVTKLANIPLTVAEKIRVRAWPLVSLLLHRRKTVLLVVIVIVVTLLVSSLVSIWLSNIDEVRFPSTGTIRTSGIRAYWDADLTNETKEIPWGQLYPGSEPHVTLYLCSISNIQITLETTIANWTFRNSLNEIVYRPANSNEYINLTWNYSGSALNPGQVTQTMFTIHVQDTIDFVEFLIERDVQQFSFDISVQAIED